VRDVVVHTCSPSTEAEVGRWRVLGKPELQSKTLFQKDKQDQTVGHKASARAGRMAQVVEHLPSK
jgi:hypothetical protein